MPAREQVIVMNELGQLSGLVHKKVGVNLTQLGHKATVIRASDIEWQTEKSQWGIRIKVGRDSGWLMSETMFLKATDNYEHGADFIQPNGEILFNDYDDAVKAEVMYFSGLDKQGVKL